MCKEGYRLSTMHYDDRGNTIGEAYFGLEGKPCLNKDGGHPRAARYGKRENLIEATWFDTQGREIAT
jgi:hypothetical protein